jgi:hypothetical protein
MAQPTTLRGITTDRMGVLIMLGRIGGTDTGHVATGGIIEIRITVPLERTKAPKMLLSHLQGFQRRNFQAES